MIRSNHCLFRYVALLFMVSTGVIGCSSSYKLPDIPLQKIANYKNYQNQNGVEVAIDVFYEQDRLSQYFGSDLLYYGILPIHVIIENNSNQHFLVEKGNIILENVNRPIRDEMPSMASMPVLKEQNDRTSGVMAAGIISLISPVVGLLPVLAAPALYKADVNTGRVKHNISTRALVDRGIYKGESNHGFLYLPLKDIIAENGNIIFQAKFKNLFSQNIITFRFNIDTIEIRKRTDKLIEMRNTEK